MEEQQKPFVCKANGCTMSFTNEDHLNVHTKKHALHLSLNNKSTHFVADQTPTPTRLIKNCDEVGLFEDLNQHVNPFDETFRRAVELNHKDSDTPTNLPASIDLTEEETLHTPHVLHFFNNSTAKTNLLHELQTPVKDQCSIKLSSNRKLKTDVKLNAKTSLITKKRKISKTEKGRKVLIKNSVQQQQQSINHLDSQYLLQKQPLLGNTVISVDKSTNLKLTQSIIGHNLTLPTNVLQVQLVTSTALPANSVKRNHNTPPLLLPKVTTEPSAPINFVRERLKAVLTKNKTDVSPKKCQLKTKTENVKIFRSTIEKQNNIASIEQSTVKPKITSADRKNAAAVRYRKKIKAWYTDVEQKNKELQTENECLKAELKQLKAFMLAHQNCSVSKAMALGQNIPIGLPKLIVQDKSLKKLIGITKKVIN